LSVSLGCFFHFPHRPGFLPFPPFLVVSEPPLLISATSLPFTLFRLFLLVFLPLSHFESSASSFMSSSGPCRKPSPRPYIRLCRLHIQPSEHAFHALSCKNSPLLSLVVLGRSYVVGFSFSSSSPSKLPFPRQVRALFRASSGPVFPLFCVTGALFWSGNFHLFPSFFLRKRAKTSFFSFDGSPFFLERYFPAFFLFAVFFPMISVLSSASRCLLDGPVSRAVLFERGKKRSSSF